MDPGNSEILDQFYAAITLRLRDSDVPSAITGGLACVEFGLVQHTEDCDLICAANRADTVLRVLSEMSFANTRCQYRKTSPPLDARWLAHGYTAHFFWPGDATGRPYLDIFGAPPRVSTAWEKETAGLFAGMHTVAEMKRTNRRKDWDQATALGLAMLEKQDSRGWLHIFDANTLRLLVKKLAPEPAEILRRPVLELAINGSPLLDRAVQTEVEFWMRLNEIRLRIYQESHSAYGRAMQAASKNLAPDLYVQHQSRVDCANQLLPVDPLHDYGVSRLIAEAKAMVAIGLDPLVLQYLPPVEPHFNNLGGVTHEPN